MKRCKVCLEPVRWVTGDSRWPYDHENYQMWNQTGDWLNYCIDEEWCDFERDEDEIYEAKA